MNTCHRGVWYLHVRIRCWAFDVQVHRHVALPAVVQPTGPQAEVQLWRSLDLKDTQAHTPIPQVAQTQFPLVRGLVRCRANASKLALLPSTGPCFAGPGSHPRRWTRALGARSPAGPCVRPSHQRRRADSSFSYMAVPSAALSAVTRKGGRGTTLPTPPDAASAFAAAAAPSALPLLRHSV